MKKISRILALAICLLMALGALPVSAAAYKSYTYSIGGEPLASPDGYTPYKVVTSADMNLPESVKSLSSPTDLEVDDQGYRYICDPVNSQILILDRYNKYVTRITSFYNTYGIYDTIAGAQGVFITKSDEEGNRLIYVADTDNKRIVVFSFDGVKPTFVRLFEEPSSDIFDDDSVYKPVALAVDISGRMYVVSATTYEGIISLDNDGSFSAFIGATKATVSAFKQLWKKFQTAEQRQQTEDSVSVEYNNIVIDESGFIYVTTSALNEGSQQGAITGKSKGTDYAPVKRLNGAGSDVMRRNGFYPPSGEVSVSNHLTSTNKDAPTGASTIVDVALGEEETWSILDQKRSRIFTYDFNGNLLYAFGDMGTQLGNLKRAVALTYDGTDLLVLDGETNSFNIYERTEYGTVLIDALHSTNIRKYDKAVEGWTDILKRNNNYDAAYVGIGNALYRDGKWEEAMDMYKTAYDTESYSNAFKQYRKDLVSKWILLIVAIVVVIIVALVLFFSYAGRLNKRTALKHGQKNFWEELLYVFHLQLHPFDGFWDLKHEKRGSVRAAIFWLCFCILSFVYQSIGRAYLFKPTNTGYASVLSQLTAVLIPLFLWVTANWCLTTLFEGEGSFKDIFIATCYSTVPLSFMVILSTIITNFVTSSESGFVTLTLGLGWVWAGLLLFIGTMVTHDYSLGKNILTIIGTIIGMALIMFLLILFSGLCIKMVSFVSNIVTEISYRS